MSLPRGARDAEGGFTLVELLTAIAVSLVVIAVITGSVINALQTQRRQVAQVDALNAAKLAFERITRDVRAADPLLIAEPDRVRMEVERDGQRRVVTYWLADGRVLVEDGAGADPRRLVEGVAPAASRPLFTFHLFDGTEVVGTAVADPRRVRSITVGLRVTRPEAGEVVDLTNRVLIRNAER